MSSSLKRRAEPWARLLGRRVPNREHETNAPVASNSYGQFPNWRAWRKGDVLRSWQKITLGEDYGTVPARRDHRDACRRLRYGRAASPCRCRRDQDADQGATGCPELEGLLAVAMVLKERLKEGDIDAANQLFHQRNCVRIKPGTSVTVIELSPFGECLRPDYWPLGGPACLWTLKGSFGD